MHKTMSEVIEFVRASAKGELVGYESWEIPKIEKLYNIKIDRSLKEFLLAMGRCSGGVISNKSIVLYSPHAFIRTYLRMEFGLVHELERLKYFELVRSRPFFFAIEDENYYLSLATAEEGEQFVYCFDEEKDTVNKTKETFSSYIYRQAKWELECYNQCVICYGDLLKI